MKNIIYLIVIMMSVFSCEESENDTLISKFYDTESHNAGENCMECHTSGGEGEGKFTVAGTVYNASKTDVSANGKIQLFLDQSKSDLLTEIEVDGKGNFYTTESIGFESGLYISAMNSSGVTEDMSSSSTSGACNICHNGSMRIFVN